MYIMFLIPLILSTLLAISSPSWMIIWMGLEINLMSMIALLSMSKEKTDSPMKYFMIQSLASIFLMMGFLSPFKQYLWTSMLIIPNIIIMALLLKMACPPFHHWLPAIMKNTKWMNCMLITTWQKIAPLIILMKMNTKILLIPIALSAIIGPMGGFNQLNLKKIMAYSSIGHLSWMLAAMFVNSETLMTYFLIYTLMTITLMMMLLLNNISNTSQILNLSYPKMTNIMIFLTLLSLGGLPPLLGFYPKWLTINNMMNSHMYIITLMLIMSSLITLYYYLRISYQSFMLNSNPSLLNRSFKSNNQFIILLMFTLFSLPLMMI